MGTTPEMKEAMRTIAIDFDGTLCRYQTFGDGTITNPPNEGATEILTRFREEGYKIVIFTVRLNTCWGGESNARQRAELENWLVRHGIPYDEVTNNKPAAVAYIDDRGIRFTNWRDIGNYFLT